MKHPDEETLLDYAGGQLDLPMRVVVESHLEFCDHCRNQSAEFAAPGGWLLEHGGVPVETPRPELWRSIEAALPVASAPDPISPEIPLPRAARGELPAGGKIRWWSWFLGGGRMAVLAEDAASGSRLMLGEMPGGLVFPRHEHLGFEHAVVLAGGYDDERGEFLAGDYAVYEPGSEHGPHTLDGDPCWILFRLEGTVRFRGWRGAVQRLFTGSA